MPGTSKAITVRHDGPGGHTERGAQRVGESGGWTFIDIAIAVVILLLLTGATIWAVLTLQDHSAEAVRVNEHASIVLTWTGAIS